MIVPIKGSEIAYDKKFQGMCRLPFYSHPYGCPNYGKKEGCPPNQPMIYDLFDLNSDAYIIFTEFPVGEFAERMRATHSQWEGEPREWYNPRRWQPVARKEHANDVKAFLTTIPCCTVTSSPEANGVDLTKTMKSIGINLDWQWPPKHRISDLGYMDNISYVISIGGHPK